jgi:hypothetical protein
MRNERTLTPLESLRVISRAIDKTHDNIAGNSFLFLLWGWLMVAASIGFFALQHYTTFKYYFIPFPILAASGVLTSIVYYYRRRVNATQTYVDHFLSRMWMVMGAGFIAVVFVNVSQGNTPFTYTLLMGGIGTLISGLVLRFTPLAIGGGIMLIAAVTSVYVPEGDRVLLQAGAVVAGYLIPGYLLRNSR